MKIFSNLNKKYFAIIFFLLPSIMFTHAQNQLTPEYEIKAVFIFNFAQFVQWPDSTLGINNEPLIIGVLGEDPFGSYLDQIVNGESIKGHPLQVRRFNNVNEIKSCHILFINSQEKEILKQQLKSLKGKTVLTIGDDNDFVQLGGIIRFLTIDNKIRFQINLAAARAADLSISSKLLRVADVVDN